jgi:hypothetical protein
MRLDALGWTQEEIAEQLKELYPEARGTTQQSVSNFLQEMSNSSFFAKITSDLSQGFSIDDIAKDRRLPPILIWALKLKDLDDQKKFDALSIKIQRLTGTQSLKNAAVGFTSILTSFTPGIFSVKVRRSLANCSATVGPACVPTYTTPSIALTLTLGQESTK